MLHKENLEEIIFNKHLYIDCDELTIITGYLGANPVEKLKDLPFKSKVIYGMFAESGISKSLDAAMKSIDAGNADVEIYYSTIPVHAKCYLWKKNGQLVHALVGSANFSSNGLRTPHREVLAECAVDCFASINDYWKLILDKSNRCTDDYSTADQDISRSDLDEVEVQAGEYSCKLSLLQQGGVVSQKSGLNWGHGNGHNNVRDSEIRITMDHIRNHTKIFPPKRRYIESKTNAEKWHHHEIDVIWDDGEAMVCRLEGSQEPSVGVKCPKQVASAESKAILGDYLRKRLGIQPGQLVKKDDLDSYGRTDIDVTLESDGTYLFDFSKAK